MPQSFGTSDGGGLGEIERPVAFSQGDADPVVSPIMDIVRDTGAFSAKKQQIARLELK